MQLEVVIARAAVLLQVRRAGGDVHRKLRFWSWT